MTHVLAAPDFVRGPGLLTEVRGAIRSIRHVTRRLHSNAVTSSEDTQEVWFGLQTITCV